MWERAINECNHEDTEHKWFGEITIGNIICYLPKDKQKLYISQVNIDSLRNKQIKAIVLLFLAEYSKGDERITLQKEAWKNAAPYYGSPRYNSNDFTAATLEWEGASDKEKQNQRWISTIINMFDSRVMYEIWQEYLFQAKAGEVETGRNDEFVGQISVIAEVLPEWGIMKGCYDCYEFFRIAGRKEKIAKMIEKLIIRLPEYVQADTKKALIEYGLNLQPSHVPYYKPKDLAKFLNEK